MLKKLSILEKIYLRIKGKNDAKKKQFKEVTIDIVLENDRENNITTENGSNLESKQNEDSIEEDILEYEKEDLFNLSEDNMKKEPNLNTIENIIPNQEQKESVLVETCMVQVSGFMMRELKTFKAERDHLISCKIFRVRKTKDKMGHFVSFTKAINFIEMNLVHLKAQISIEETKYCKTKERLQCKYDKYKSGLASVKKLRECELEMQNSREKYLKEQEKNYLNAIFLLYEEIRILEQMQALLELKKNHCFLRIRYYYEKANIMLNQLPIVALTDCVLSQMGELVELGDKYEKILKKAYELEEDFKKKYSVSTDIG